ncbi:MAG: XdhC family protein [Pirellulales bacterium]
MTLSPAQFAEIERGRRAVLCRLVETRGSTPQKAGAAMLVFADGSQSGTLGGGCVEAEVKRRALAVMERGAAEIATFQLDNDYGWDDGLICGGRMTVLVDPLADEAARQYVAAVANAAEAKAAVGSGGATEVIVFDAEKAGLPATACYLFDASEQMVASLRAGPAVETELAALRASLRPLSIRPRPYAAGGVSFLPLLPRTRLLIVGGGHVGQALGQLAADLDFDVWVVDDRAEYANAERFPQAERCIVGPVGPTLAEMDITSDTYCVIVTRGHNHDEEALLHLANRGARYVGMIGSRRKIKLIYDDLMNDGVSAEALQRVFAPLGIDIGSQTVMEIAVSIAAELVAHRNREGVVPGRPAAIDLSGQPA